MGAGSKITSKLGLVSSSIGSTSLLVNLCVLHMVSGYWVRKLIPVVIWGESGYDKKCVILNHEWTIRVGIIVESCGYVVIGRALKNETFWLLTLQIGWVELKLWLSEVYSSVITEMEVEFFTTFPVPTSFILP